MGAFRNTIGTFDDTIVANTGATSPDYFILKWGLPCSDTINSLDAPEAPDNLEATALSQQSIEVIWHNTAPYRQGFHLYRSPDGVSNCAQIADIAPTQYVYTDNGLSPNTTYWYKIAAYTSGGESAFSNIDSATTWPTSCSAAISRTNADSVYTFHANPTGFGTLTYQWSVDGTGFSTAATPSLTLTTPGTYSICVTVTDAGSCTASDCDTVTITPFTCSTAISHTQNDTVFNFSTTNTGTGPYTYAWSNNGSAFSTSDMPALTLSGAGSYNICVTVTDANQCQSSDCETIVISSVNDEQLLNVVLYPNPANDVIHLQTAGTDLSAQLMVTDMLGKVVVQNTVKLRAGDVLHLSCGDWQPGVYMIQLTDGHAGWKGKVVKY